MIGHWVYVQNKNGTIHLADFERFHLSSSTRTLCGKRCQELLLGDETITGVAATCNACRIRIGRGTLQNG